MNSYRTLKQQVFINGDFSIVPICMEDRYNIMKWRNEQMYHLRQNQLLTKETQDEYFQNVVEKLFDQDKPQQILFSYLQGGECIGYGGLVHINWSDRNAEISFIMDTSLEELEFDFHWTTYLGLIEQVAFKELRLNKIFTYTYDIRFNLFLVLEKNGYFKDAVLFDHCYFDNEFKDVIIHAKRKADIRKVNVSDAALTYRWATDDRVRKYSFNREKIEWKSHLDWFTEKIQKTECLYYIIHTEHAAIGSIRFDLQGESATISYLIDPAFHGKGWGIQLLKMGIDKITQDANHILKMEGWVMSENIASIKIFEKLGFIKEEEDNFKARFILKIA